MKWINRLYIFFLGIILSITTGFGIAAFYPEPVAPNYSYSRSAVPDSCYNTPESQKSAECQQAIEKQRIAEQEQNKAQEAYTNKNAGYTRTIIFLGIVIASIFALIGISTIKDSKLVANGLLLSAVLTAVLTRFLITLASLGNSTTSSTRADNAAYLEFAVLLILSGVVVFVGVNKLKDSEISSELHIAKKK
jgi:hypothetical protein